MHLCQSNPILDIDESLLSEEEPVSMATGEDEEGAISEISNTDVLEDTHPKLKVSIESLKSLQFHLPPPPSSTKLLERLLWYLRLVHSLDYYNAIVFPSEDNMPHRCGIFTVRSVPPVTTTPEDRESDSSLLSRRPVRSLPLPPSQCPGIVRS